jgi:hypothetical protein
MNTWLNFLRNPCAHHFVKYGMALSAFAVVTSGCVLSASSQTADLPYGPRPLPREVIDALEKAGIDASIAAIAGSDGSLVLFYDPEKANVGQDFPNERPIRFSGVVIPDDAPVAVVFVGSARGGVCPPRPSLGDPPRPGCPSVSSK